MIDLKTGKDMSSENHLDYVRQLEVITEELPYGIKQYKDQVSDLVAMDKKLSALQEKADKNASVRLADKIESLGLEYVAAYKRCASALSVINAEIEKANVLFVKLSDYYASVGNRKAAKRVRSSLDRFEKDNSKRLDAAVEAMNSISGIEYIKAMDKESPKMEKTVKEETKAYREEPIAERRTAADAEAVHEPSPRRREEAAKMPPPPPRYQNPYYDPYRMPQYSYQPAPSFNIAPISIDVNRAVESAVDSFVSLFEERVGKYLSDKIINEEKATPAPDPNEVAAIEKIAEDESFALDKLVSILEGMKKLMTGIGELNEAYLVLEEKQKAALESAKTLSDMQRNLARELQGIQATQKVISVDQMATGEEQAVIFEQQKTTLAAQTELSERQTKLTGDQLEIVKTHQSLDGEIAAINELLSDISQKEEEMLRSGTKTLELQKTLSEKQTDLTELQREALLAQKKLARSQRALNEKLGAKRRASIDSSEPVEQENSTVEE